MRIRRRRTLPTLWEVTVLAAGAGLGMAALIRHDPMCMLPQHWAKITIWVVALTAILSGLTVSVMLLLVWHRSVRHRAWNDGAVMFFAVGLTVVALAGLAIAKRYFSDGWDPRPGGTDLLWWVGRGLRVVRFGALTLTIAALMSGRYWWWAFRSHWVDSVGMWVLGAWSLLAVFDLFQMVRA